MLVTRMRKGETFVLTREGAFDLFGRYLETADPDVLLPTIALFKGKTLKSLDKRTARKGESPALAFRYALVLLENELIDEIELGAMLKMAGDKGLAAGGDRLS